MLLAGDAGGTSTRLGLSAAATARPAPLEVRTYATGDFPTREAMAAAFLDAFRAKAPMQALVGATPVHVIVHPDPGLLGAAAAKAVGARC
jgi:glucokinase